MPDTCDVAVIGLGGAGSAVAYHLARRGVRVVGLDAAGRANTTGASHGGSRIVRMAYAEGDDFLPLLRRAHTLWDELGELAGTPVLRRCGVLFAGRHGSAVVGDTLAAARRHGLAIEPLDLAGLRRRSPLVRWSEDSVGCFDPRAGLVRPEQVVGLHLDLAAGHGAVLKQGTRLLGWDEDDGGVRVRTDAGDISAGHLVLCAGAWAPALAPAALDGRITVQRQVQHWFGMPPVLHAGLAPERWPVHVWDDDGLFYAMPMLDGAAGGLKCCLESTAPPTGIDAIDPGISPEDVAGASDRLHRHLPSAGPWLRGAVCHYAASPDNRFVVGPAPGTARVTLACGLGGHGFKFTPAIGELVAESIMGPTPTGPFDPARLQASCLA